ncbi:hypothetical protein CULT_1110014 [[Clostridium] ultunense Esp]|nr:hypothetical protein CULT_1110014 [[Clostridium] ultunense Esp]
MKDKTVKFKTELVLEDIEIDQIKLKKQEDKESLIRCTYYLTQQLIDAINEKSEVLNMGKSEFLREIVEIALDHLEIEE